MFWAIARVSVLFKKNLFTRSTQSACDSMEFGSIGQPWNDLYSIVTGSQSIITMEILQGTDSFASPIPTAIAKEGV